MTLERWTADGSTAVDDPDRRRELARRLRQTWKAHNGPDLPPNRAAPGSGVELTDQDRAELEATGGLTLGVAAEFARTGVDYLSVGALTHSSPIVDIALDLRPR